MLVVSIAIPWLLGVALLRLVPEGVEPGHGPGSVAWSLGCGWFVGAFVLTLWMRALSLTGVKFGFAVVALPLAGAALLALAVLLRRNGRALRDGLGHAARTLVGSGLEGWKRAAWFALLAWLGLRFALLLFENVERPLYAWDAWAHWATKARVWFELKSIVPFVSASEWLQATGLAYTDYNPHYPGTVPLLQVWGALALGRWDDALINLPWWVTGVALALAIYGFLAERGLGALTALVGAWLVVSLPIFDTHVALPGYADLPLAAYFALTGLALWRWLDRRGWKDASLVLLFACACATIKNPGRAWVLVLVPAVIAGVVPRQGVRIAFASLGAAILLLLALARINLTLFGYQLHLDFTPPWQGLIDAYLLYGNWHLLWYAALAIAVLGWRQLLTKEIAPLTVLLVSSLLFLLFGFAFTNASAWVEDQSTVNRATLPVAPLLVVWILVVFEAWAARLAPPPERRTPAASSPTPAVPEFKRLEQVRSALGTGAETAAAPSIPVVGRNDPCPCGSGKRYKQCHGAVDKQVEATPAKADAPPQEALFLRAIAAHQRGDVDAAERDYRAALELAPDHVHASHYLGVVLYQTQRLDEALPLLEQAAQRIPQEPEFHNNFGLALAAADRTDEAIAAYRRALALKPDHALAWNNLGLALHAARKPAAAIEAYLSALRYKPDFFEAHNNLGNALKDMDRLDEALVSYDLALNLRADLAEVHVNRGNVLLSLRRVDEALASYARAMQIDPEHPLLFGTYMHTRMTVCDWENWSTDLTRYVSAITAGKLVTAPFPLLSLIDDPELHLVAATLYSNAEFPRSVALRNTPECAANRKLRIGYYSSDFRDHATAYLIAELLETHDASKFELYGFSLGPNVQDAMRDRIAAAFGEFVDATGKSDHEIAKLSRDFGIDIAVDLNGFTRNARPGIFAARCAPLQVSYLGYPGTMGAKHIDYLIADRSVIPEESQQYYTEKIIYLPNSYQVNDSRRRISDRVFSRQELGLPATGFVFCCFNNNYKILPSTFDGWMRILSAVEGSALWLLEDNPAAARNLRKEAKARGIDASRLVFAQRLKLDEHLARQRVADLFIDTLPCNAHTTASDALWAGLPVLTCTGKSFASRVAGSLLNAIGLPELIAHTQEEYETMAIELARSPGKLGEIRQKLAQNRLTTPLFDCELFAKHLEAAYEKMYAQHKAGQAPAFIDISSGYG